MLRSGLLIYPFLFAIYPILFLWSNNIQELSVFSSREELLLPMAISVMFALLLLAVFRIILRDWRTAGLFAAFVLLLFYSYGHVLDFVSVQGNPEYAKNRYLVIIWPIIFVAGSLLLIRFRANLRNLTNPLNVISLILIIFTLPNIIGYEAPKAAALEEAKVKSGGTSDPNPVEAGTLPDIYYITAEGYSGSRSLKNILNYDNSSFTDYLKRNNFYVASESNSNYGQTLLSLNSSLNMEYIDLANIDQSNLTANFILRLQNNNAMRFAREHGYSVVYLTERFPPGSKDLGDTYFGCGARRLGVRSEGFADTLLQTTALQPILTRFTILEHGGKSQRLCQFFQIAKSKEIEGPKVVLVHLVVPGFPFVVGVSGELVAGSATSAKPEAYLNQLAWTNKMLEWLINSLLSDQTYNPIIIFQGDHGEGWVDLDSQPTYEEELHRAFSIMNAYHLPDGGDSLLYPSISPVNTFRIIFNHYLNADFALLDDRTFLNVTSSPNYEFIEVTDVVREVFKD